MYSLAVPTDAEITFADHVGRFYARRYAFPPMVGRLLGYLAVCDPPEQTIGELAEALLASRSAIAGAVKALETMRTIQRSRSAGERMDRVRIDLSSPQAMGMDISEYEELGELAREGLEVLRDAPAERRAVLWRWRPSPISSSNRCRDSSRRGPRAGPSWSPPETCPSSHPRDGPMSAHDGPAIEASGVRKSFGDTSCSTAST